MTEGSAVTGKAANRDNAVALVRTSLVVAANENDVIGRGGALPWYLPDDLRRFRVLTTPHVVVAGRKTHESIVARLGHPLPGRITVVVSRSTGHGAVGDDVVYRGDVGSALSTAGDIELSAGRGSEIFVIGGATIYAQALPWVDQVYLTRVHNTVDGDTVMPAGWLRPFTLSAEEEHRAAGFSFLTYERATNRHR